MPGMMEEAEDVKIRVAKILGLRYLDQVDVLSEEVLHYVEQHWNTTEESLMSNGVVSQDVLTEIRKAGE